MKRIGLLSCALVLCGALSMAWAQVPGAGFLPLAPYPPRAVVLTESDSGPEILLLAQSLTSARSVVLDVWNTDTGWRHLAAVDPTPAGSRNLPYSLLDVRDNIDGSRSYNFWHPVLDSAGANIEVGRVFGSRLSNATTGSQINTQLTTDGFLSLASFNFLQHDATGNRIKRQTKVFKARPSLSPSTFSITPGSRANEVLFLKNPLRISTWDGLSWTALNKRIGPDRISVYLRFAPQSAYTAPGSNAGWLALVQGEQISSAQPGHNERVLLYEFNPSGSCASGCERYNIGRPASVSIMSPPLLLIREFPGQTRQINVWVSDEATGHLWERHHNGSSWSAWVRHGTPPGAKGVRLESGVIWHDEAGRMRINLFGQENWQVSATCTGVFLGGALVERAWDGAVWQWGNREKPGRVGETITLNDSCIQTPSGHSQLDPSRFVNDLDRQLPLRVGSAIAVQYPGGGYRLSVFAVDTRGKTHERVWDTRTGGNWVWQ